MEQIVKQRENSRNEEKNLKSNKVPRSIPWTYTKTIVIKLLIYLMTNKTISDIWSFMYIFNFPFIGYYTHVILFVVLCTLYICTRCVDEDEKRIDERIFFRPLNRSLKFFLLIKFKYF
ncbi:hypothetical protein Mgra_00001741 [Meloidogyne graminicola]|uniref:Uncharacterized protein n=1 Tax=Meloidogyne graminicola TaxID=189291 RepID=A0A8S9ZZF1_9BILA|nr:hypothetical protein Mgra_00001741 [Meloidogyne graminicola]